MRLLAAVLFFAAGTASAAAPEGWPAGDREAVTRIEAYLESMTTVRANFLQVNADGTLDSGIMWLWRPGLARIEYAPPTEVLMVATGTWLVYFDAELDQVSHIPADSGPFRFLLDEEVRFGEGVELRGLARGSGLLKLTLADAEDPGAGSVTLVFDETPMALRQWEVRDAQGFLTIVTLTDAITGETFDRDWFYFPDSARRPDFRIGQFP
ncbi:MAG: outer membrane lipoprotein carrier protein LolA [Alphaproteobacteria bacterium]|nr:outer membrane lipoprotein carrier protein LolA [Alphaproteobacteria bacterium]